MEFQKRLQSIFPVNIQGFNLLGEHYDETALVENFGQRGLCIRTFQNLVPGSIFILHKMGNELGSVGFFQVVWSKRWNENTRKLGAQLLGDNYYWMQFLTRDVVILSEARIIRDGSAKAA